MPRLTDYPPHVCGECGSISEEVARALAVRDEMIETLREDVSNLERDLRMRRAQIKRMQREQDESVQRGAFYDDAIEVLEHWKALCAPRARELAGKRVEHCVARLKGGYTVEELKRAVWGYSLKPYVVDGKRMAEGPRDALYVDAELIFRDPKKVDAGLAIADHADSLNDVIAATPEMPEVVGELSELGQAALRLAEGGWAVFPCRPRDKVPWTANGLLDAKRDPGMVRATWGAHPDLNVGLPTGATNGLLVLDVDGEEGVESLRALERRYGPLPVTASVVTPRGGQHYYFKHPGVEVRNTAGYPGAGLDVRGDGGYVLAVPSVGPAGRRYEADERAPLAELPRWLLKALVDRQEHIKGLPPEERAKLIAGGATEGSRNSRLASHVGWLLHHFDSHDVVREMAHVFNDARFQPPLGRREADQVVDSMIKRDSRKAKR